MLARERAHFVEVDQFGILPHAVRDRVVEFAGETDLRAVREVAAVRERHAEHRDRPAATAHEDRHIGLRAGVRLHVGVIGAEDRFQTGDRENLRLVDPFASAVIPFARITFGVLVGHDARVGFANRLAGVVLRRYQLEVVALTLLLTGDGGKDFGIGRFDVAGRQDIHQRSFLGVSAPVTSPRSRSLSVRIRCASPNSKSCSTRSA